MEGEKEKEKRRKGERRGGEEERIKEERKVPSPEILKTFSEI
jgi:hypothetical protein